MRTSTKTWICALTAALISLPLYAQGPGGGGQGGGRGGQGGGRGNFDPAQFQQMMADRLKAELGMPDEEFKAIQPLITDVTEKSRAMRGRQFGRRGGGPGGQAATAATDDPTADALTKLLDDPNSSNEAIAAALKAYREDRKAKEADLQAAREKLRAALTVRQEARLVLSGILD